MTVGTFTFVNSGKKDAVVDGDWTNDNHYAVLINHGFTPLATHDTLSDISGSENADGDYARQDLVGESTTQVTANVKLDANQVDFGAAVTIASRYIYLLLGTVGTATGVDKIVGYMDLRTENDGNVSSSSGDFKVDWNVSNGIALIG
jgi:hypothetical protein